MGIDKLKKNGTPVRALFRNVRSLPFHPQWLLGIKRPVQAVALLRGKVLDVGCADRWVEACCARDVDYVGLDFPLTGENFYRAHPDIFADAALLPVLSASVDAVVCLEVLEHVCHPHAALAEFARVLKPGGTMLFSMPFMYPIHDAPHDFQRLTEFGLRRDFAAAGFDIVRLEKVGHAVRTAGLLFCLALVGGIYARRKWTDYLRMPFVMLAVLIVNVLATVVAWLIPDWSALGMGYSVQAKRR